MMKIVITEQILIGNLHEGFQLTPYLTELAVRYRETVESRYPGAEVEIKTDIQRACGYCRPLSVDVFNDAGEWIDDGDGLIDWLNNDAEKLADDERWYA